MRNLEKFRSFLGSLSTGKEIKSHHKGNESMIVLEVDIEGLRVKLYQKNLSKDSARWYSELEFVESKV